MTSTKPKRTAPRSPDIEKEYNPVKDALGHLDRIIGRESIAQRRKNNISSFHNIGKDNPHEPHDWSFLRPLKLKPKPKPPLKEVNIVPKKRKPPPPNAHNPKSPIIEPHGGWSRNRSKKRKKGLIITLPKAAVAKSLQSPLRSQALRRRREMNAKAKAKLKPFVEVSSASEVNISSDYEDEETSKSRSKAKKKMKKKPAPKSKPQSKQVKKKTYQGQYRWKNSNYEIFIFRRVIATQKTEKGIAREWDKFIFEAQNHGRTINEKFFNFPKALPTRRKRSKNRVYFKDYRNKLDLLTEDQIESLQRPLNKFPKTKS